MAGALELPVPELLERVLERSGYVEALEAERTVEAQGRIENLQEPVGVAREYEETAEQPTLSEFLQQISLYSDQDEIDEERSYVTLMTLHNAKGLEFRAVFLIGMEEGVFPHSRSLEEQGLEEERRLAYVGLTRGKGRLRPGRPARPGAASHGSLDRRQRPPRDARRGRRHGDRPGWDRDRPLRRGR